MRARIRLTLALLAALALAACSSTGIVEPPSQASVNTGRYQTSDLYGLWYFNAAQGTSQVLALLLLRADGSATDFLIVSDEHGMQKIVQQSTWSYDAGRNAFEQRISEVSVHNGPAAASVTHPREVVRASVEWVKLDDKVMGIRFTRQDGEVTSYLKGSAAMLEKLKQIK